MRLTLLCILFSFGIISCRFLHFLNPKNKKYIEIQTSCGFTGQVSSEFTIIKNFLSAKNDTSLLALVSEKAIGNNIRLQLLSIIAIDNILKERPIKMTLVQEQEIIAFKKRRDKVLVCSGCDPGPFTTIHDLFKNSSSSQRAFIDAILGQKKK